MREGFVTAEDGVRLYFQRTGLGPDAIAIPNGFYLLMTGDWQLVAGGDR